MRVELGNRQSSDTLNFQTKYRVHPIIQLRPLAYSAIEPLCSDHINARDESLVRDNFIPINTPFPGGEGNDTKKTLGLDVQELGEFFAELTDVWLMRGYGQGVSVGPIDELVKTFTDGGGRLPCIWQSNCADEFISIDARGYVAQCECWVTSCHDYFFGNIFECDSLKSMLSDSPARRKFVERPAVVIPRDCIECDYLSICHGGCPVRTYTFTRSMFEKDPYCEVYLAIFKKADEVAARLSRSRALNEEIAVVPLKQRFRDEASVPNFSSLPSRLVQIERRSVGAN